MHHFDFTAANATSALLREAASILRGINATEMISRLSSLKAGTNRKDATYAETAALTAKPQQQLGPRDNLGPDRLLHRTAATVELWEVTQRLHFIWSQTVGNP